jgi:hypothetical protein
MLMFRHLAGLIGVSMQIFSQSQPPQILQIYRDRLKPGSHVAYREIEQDIARVCADLGFPHAYLAIEPLMGPEEVWFLNGWESAAEQKQVADAYAKNTPLVTALETNGKRKASLTLKPVDVSANYRQNLSSGTPWAMGMGRYLVVTVTKTSRRIDGTVFEIPDGTKFVLLPAKTREEADAKVAAAGSEARVFAVRPYWSNPAKDWVAADPVFWQSSPAARVK